MAASFDEQIVPVYAALRADGSIEVELLIPENDEPSLVTIPAIRETRELATPHITQEIMLDADGNRANGILRRIVSDFVRKAEERRLDALRAAEAQVRA